MFYSMLIGMALKSTAVLGVAWLIAFLLRRHSAAARHLVWTAAAAAVVTLPLLSISLPVLRLPMGAALAPAADIVVAATGQATRNNAGVLQTVQSRRTLT